MQPPSVMRRCAGRRRSMRSGVRGDRRVKGSARRGAAERDRKAERRGVKNASHGRSGRYGSVRHAPCGSRSARTRRSLSIAGHRARRARAPRVRAAAAAAGGTTDGAGDGEASDWRRLRPRRRRRKYQRRRRQRQLLRRQCQRHQRERFAPSASKGHRMATTMTARWNSRA